MQVKQTTIEEQIIVTLLSKLDSIKVKLSAVTSKEDVTPQQYNILRILRGAGETGLPTLEIGNRMLEHSPGITRLIDRLERKNLVERVRSDIDRRLVTCKITPAGLEVLDKLQSDISNLHHEVSSTLSFSEKEHFLSLLNRFCG